MCSRLVTQGFLLLLIPAYVVESLWNSLTIVSALMSTEPERLVVFGI
jgi:hypothetical protein